MFFRLIASLSLYHLCEFATCNKTTPPRLYQFPPSLSTCFAPVERVISTLINMHSRPESFIGNLFLNFQYFPLEFSFTIGGLMDKLFNA